MGQPLRESRPRRFRPLAAGASVHDVADRCRRAVEDFVSGTAGGWSRTDLDLWLGAPYRSATSSFPCVPSPLAVVDVAVLETWLLEAAEVAREMLASCAGPRAPSFVEDAVERGFVVGVKDANGALGHVPVDDASMTLVDRVASLVAADFLTRPSDYRSVTICDDCGAVCFEWTACDHSSCAEARESGVVRRDDGAPASYAAIFPPSGAQR